MVKILLEQHFLFFNHSLGLNLAIGRPTDQSSFQPGKDFSLAVDGDVTAGYSVTQASASPYMEVQLAQDYIIGHVVIYSRADCCGT